VTAPASRGALAELMAERAWFIRLCLMLAILPRPRVIASQTFFFF
jgi:hypothetical protein